MTLVPSGLLMLSWVPNLEFLVDLRNALLLSISLSFAYSSSLADDSLS